MTTREHPVACRPEDWTHAGQAFRHFDGRLPESTPREPRRVTTPDSPAASIEAWRSSPFVARELSRAERRGFGWGCVITTLWALIVLTIAGIHP